MQSVFAIRSLSISHSFVLVVCACSWSWSWSCSSPSSACPFNFASRLCSVPSHRSQLALFILNTPQHTHLHTHTVYTLTPHSFQQLQALISSEAQYPASFSLPSQPKKQSRSRQNTHKSKQDTGTVVLDDRTIQTTVPRRSTFITHPALRPNKKRTRR